VAVFHYCSQICFRIWTAAECLLKHVLFIGSGVSHVAEDEAAEPGAQAPNKGVPTLTVAEKVRIVAMHEKGISNRKIGEAMGRSNGAVARTIKAWEQNERLERASGSGRKRKTSAADDRGIRREVIKDRFVSTVDILALAPYQHLYCTCR
jgi:hypothetical protein